MNDLTRVLLQLTQAGNVVQIKELIGHSNGLEKIAPSIVICSDNKTKKEEARQILLEAFKKGDIDLIDVLMDFFINDKKMDLSYSDPLTNPLVLAIAELPKLEEAKRGKALEALIKYVNYDVFNISLNATDELPSVDICKKGDVTPSLKNSIDIISFSLLSFLCIKKFLPDAKDLAWIKFLIAHGANPMSIQLTAANGEQWGGSLDSFITQSLSKIAKLHNDNDKLTEERAKYSVIIEWTENNSSFKESNLKKRYEDINEAIKNLKNVLKTSVFLQKASAKSTSVVYKDLKEFNCDLSNALAQDSFLVMKFLKNMTAEAIQQSLQKTLWATKKNYQFLLPMIDYINNIFNKISDKNNTDVQIFNNILILLNDYNVESELKIPLLFKNNEERDKFFDNHKPMGETKKKELKQSEIKNETSDKTVTTSTDLIDTFGVIREQRKEEKPSNDLSVRNNAATFGQ